MSKIVSFDFDKTLSKPEVQRYAKRLIAKGIDVWVVTARYDDLHLHLWPMSHGWDNSDLWAVVDAVGIPRWKVRFMNMQGKYKFLFATRVIWHLDDDPNELYEIEHCDTTVQGISVLDNDWKEKCDRLLGIKNKKNENKGI